MVETINKKRDIKAMLAINIRDAPRKNDTKEYLFSTIIKDKAFNAMYEIM